MTSRRNEPAAVLVQDDQGPGNGRGAARARSRWTVHLTLLITLTAALLPLLMFGSSARVPVHVVIACVFLGLVIVHLTQRRHTLRRLIVQFGRAGGRIKGRRLAVSDAIFAFLIANVLASGIYNLATGSNARVPLPGIQLFIGWHALSSVIFVGYLITHVIRRRRRLRRSRIR